VTSGERDRIDLNAFVGDFHAVASRLERLTASLEDFNEPSALNLIDSFKEKLHDRINSILLQRNFALAPPNLLSQKSSGLGLSQAIEETVQNLPQFNWVVCQALKVAEAVNENPSDFPLAQ
jgi:hypothetical protein